MPDCPASFLQAAGVVSKKYHCQVGPWRLWQSSGAMRVLWALLRAHCNPRLSMLFCHWCARLLCNTYSVCLICSFPPVFVDFPQARLRRACGLCCPGQCHSPHVRNSMMASSSIMVAAGFSHCLHSGIHASADILAGAGC